MNDVSQVLPSSPASWEQRHIRTTRLQEMGVPFRTFIFLGVAVGMLGGGYLFAPQPAATARPMPPVAKMAPPVPAPMAAASRPPVPLVTRTPTSYFVQKVPESAKTAEGTQIATPGATGTSTSETKGVAQANAISPSGSNPRTDARAQAAVERDGYKNVRGLVKGPDGVWRGRAMRGSTEIAISVDASGSVSAQ